MGPRVTDSNRYAFAAYHRRRNDTAPIDALADFIMAAAKFINKPPAAELLEPIAATADLWTHVAFSWFNAEDTFSFANNHPP